MHNVIIAFASKVYFAFSEWQHKLDCRNGRNIEFSRWKWHQAKYIILSIIARDVNKESGLNFYKSLHRIVDFVVRSEDRYWCWYFDLYFHDRYNWHSSRLNGVKEFYSLNGQNIFYVSKVER